MPTFNPKHIALARLAGATVNVAAAATADRTPEQQTAYAALVNAVPNADEFAAIYAHAAKPDTGATKLDIEQRADRAKRTADAMRASAAASKQATKPAADKPQAEKPAKPSASDAARAAANDERVKLIAQLRDSVATLYNGPSLAVRSNPKRIALSVYADLLASPKHRTTLDRISQRDESAIAEIIKRGNKAGEFDPAEINLDSGIFSRLASVGFIEAAPQSGKLPYRLSKRGAEHGKLIAKRAA